MRKVRPGKPTQYDTELAHLRAKLDITQPTAAAMSAGLLGHCSLRSWREYEAGRRAVPAAILAHFRQLAATIKG